jgi:hypothetical protein
MNAYLLIDAWPLLGRRGSSMGSTNRCVLLWSIALRYLAASEPGGLSAGFDQSVSGGDRPIRPDTIGFAPGEVNSEGLAYA